MPPQHVLSHAGEYLAIAVSLEDLGVKTANARARLLSKTLMEVRAEAGGWGACRADSLPSLRQATGTLLANNQSPSRKVKELDNRGSAFYIALYWAQASSEGAAVLVYGTQVTFTFPSSAPPTLSPGDGGARPRLQVPR